MNLLKESKAGARAEIAEHGDWLVGIPAIVAENADPEKQHRVKVIVPSIDEDMIYDEWARQMVFCLGKGFGSAFVPPKGSEVVLFGQLGQKHHLYYASIYNEEMLMPETLVDEQNVGFKTPGNMSLLVALLAKVTGQNIHEFAEQLFKMTGQNIESLAQQLNKITGQNVEITAQQLAKMLGGSATVEASGTALLKGGQVNIQGATISISNGNISITGGAVSINGSSVTIRGRSVSPVGPPI